MPNYYFPQMPASSGGGGDLGTPSKRGASLTAGNDPAMLAAVGASWWYNWGPAPSMANAPAGFVPMSWAGQMIEAGDAPVILWGNEPDNSAQANLLPAVAAGRYAKMYAVYGDRLWPAGVCLPWGDWTQQFVAQLHKVGLPTPTHWHVHCYAEQILGVRVEDCFAFWTRLHDLFPGDYIVSEFGSTDGDPGAMRAFVSWLEETPWVVRYAAFSLHIDDSQAWYPSHWPKPCPMDLVGADGVITELGRAYVGG